MSVQVNVNIAEDAPSWLKEAEGEWELVAQTHNIKSETEGSAKLILTRNVRWVQND